MHVPVLARLSTRLRTPVRRLARSSSSWAEQQPWIRRPDPNVLCHIGNGCAVVALGQQDMLNLRACMVAASSCGIAFNLLQPKPLWVPAAWGLFFVTGHCVMIGLILRDRQAVSMSEAELDAYEETYHKHGFTPRQFKRLVEVGEWQHVPPGQRITEQGTSMAHVFYVHRGSCLAEVRGEQHNDAQTIGEVGDVGSRFIGTLSPPHVGREAATWPVSVIAKTPCELLRWPAETVDALLADDPRMEAAAASTAIQDLSRKLRHAAASTVAEHARGTLEAYAAMLATAVADGRLDGSEKRLLRQYRQSHALSDADHAAALARLGWSVQEYDDGVQQRPEAAYRRMLARALEDGFVDGAEKRSLRLFRQSERISAETHRALLAEQGWTPQEFDDGVRACCPPLPQAAPESRRRGLLSRLLFVFFE